MDKEQFIELINGILKINEQGHKLCNFGFEPESELVNDIWKSADAIKDIVAKQIGDSDETIDWWLAQGADNSIVEIDKVKYEIDTPEKLWDLLSGKYDQPSFQQRNVYGHHSKGGVQNG